MPPKRGRATASGRGDETQRLSGDAAPTLASTTAAAARRPHHLISRLHPPWGGGGSGPAGAVLRTSGITPNTTSSAGVTGGAPSSTVPGRAGAAAPASDAVHGRHSRGGASLATRVAGGCARSGLIGSTAAARRRGAQRSSATVTRKRQRSTSTAPATSSDAPEELADDPGDDSGVEAVDSDGDAAPHGRGMSPCVTQLSSSSSSSSSSVSLSPSPMVAERRLLEGHGAGRRTATLRAGPTVDEAPASMRADLAHHSPSRVTRASSVRGAAAAATATPGATASETGTPHRPPPAPPPPMPSCIAVCTADSKVLFAEEEEEEAEEGPGRRVWLTSGRVGSMHDPRPCATAAEETHVLGGELSDTASVTPARPPAPSRVAASGDGAASPSRRALPDGAGDEEELLGEPLEADGGRRATPTSRPADDDAGVHGGGGGGTAALVGDSPDAAGASATFLETLPVQDLSLLTDERCGGAASAALGDSLGHTPLLLSASTGQHTPLAAVAKAAAAAVAATRERRDTTGASAAQELVLGDGLVSPPVRRITATPQHAGAGGGDDDGAEAKDDAIAPASDASVVAPRTPRGCGVALDMVGSSPSSTTTISATPWLTRAVVAAEHPTPASPSLPASSLPSTVDDGLWKAGARSTGSEEIVDADAVTPRRESGHRACSPDNGDAGAPVLAASAAATQQETVPIDPFLSTPPQYRRQWSAADGDAVARDDNDHDDGDVRGRCRPAAASPTTTSPPQPLTCHRDADAEANAGAAAARGDVPPPVRFGVGMRVEARWGRQWYPAVVKAPPHNNYVQIEWEEDGSLLHVRLREVRLRPPHSRPGATDGSDRGQSTPPPSGRCGVLTATQLVALMEEEDAEDSRHTLEPSCLPTPTAHRTPPPPAQAATLPVRARDTGCRKGTHAMEAELVDAEVTAHGGGECATRSRGASGPVVVATAAPSERRGGRASSAGTATSRRPSRSPASAAVSRVSARADEVHPASLILFLAPTARRELLCEEGTSVATASSRVPANPVAELHRILHFLATAGATVVESVAQADIAAAQIGDMVQTSSPAPPTSSTAEEPQRRRRCCSPAMHTATEAQDRRVRTVGRTSLPRRSAASDVTPAVGTTQPTHMIFLVSSASALATEGPPEVSLAHALGVSAIRASWLWSINPGAAARVPLPTAADEVGLSVCPDAAACPPGPLRWTPFAAAARWLSGVDIAFVARDDKMETWLNASGATVRAELPPARSPSLHTARRSASQDTSATAASTSAGRARASESPPRPPAAKQRRTESTPDLVHVPESAAALVELDRLGGVPVVDVQWLMNGIERHYRSASDPGQPTEPVSLPPSLAEVWPALSRAARGAAAVGERPPPPPAAAPLPPARVPTSPTAARAETTSGRSLAVVAGHTPDSAAAPRDTDTNRVAVRQAVSSPSADAEDSAEAPLLTAPPLADRAVHRADVVNTTLDGNREEEEVEAMASEVGATEAAPHIAGSPLNDEEEEDAARRARQEMHAADDATACAAHPAIGVGEDFYFSLSAPPLPAPRPPSGQRGAAVLTTSPPAVPTSTIALGRVVGLHEDAGAPLSCWCRVTLQLYEPKYISMHVEPRTGEVVHQTTVYLAQRWVTVPGSALLYNTPVYVITAAVRQHVYLLEEEGNEATDVVGGGGGDGDAPCWSPRTPPRDGVDTPHATAPLRGRTPLAAGTPPAVSTPSMPTSPTAPLPTDAPQPGGGRRGTVSASPMRRSTGATHDCGGDDDYRTGGEVGGAPPHRAWDLGAALTPPILPRPDSLPTSHT
ncbi:hypothetical protein NESM_000339300 [Novymonas esmeraldas]|uniref:BRCT domain-containing protein n=1 Tax=Novymonas esmeraldas TaxID=1808958 RepID=A0AAW0EJC8_9TRYP